MSATPDWVEIRRGSAPVLVSMPHTGIEIPPELISRYASPWLARKDTDWWLEQLYDFTFSLDITLVRTRISRSVIDANRDPSGASLYPGQATTALCPVTTFDGEDLYKPSREPEAAEIAIRRQRYFEPYHQALDGEIARLRRLHPRIVVYDAHSIRSTIPRLFEGDLPHLNIGTNSGAACAPALIAAVERACGGGSFSHVVDGRFKGGWTTRHLGDPARDIHAIQMELACRGYMHEPAGPVSEANWPTAYDFAYAAPLRTVLREILVACLAFALVS